MPIFSNRLFSNSDPQADKVQGLIFGRLLLIFLLLLAGWWWTNTYLELSVEHFPKGLFLLFVFAVCLSAVYLLFLKFNGHYLWQLRFQLLIDTILVSWLVWVTGDLVSPYITLYFILISVAGFLLGRLETLFIAALCAGSFSVLSTLSPQALIYSFTGQITPSRFVQIIAFNNVAILIVGLLAAHLSERRKVSEQLRETAANFADLHVLHERIVESIRSGLITTDLEGKIYSFNRAAEEISGIQAGQVIGQSIFSLFGEDIRASVDLCLGAVQSEVFLTEHFETRIQAVDEKDGSERQITVACTVAPLFEKTGNVYGLLVTFQDITQIRVMEETLRRSDRLAAVGRMAAGLAHEIRNPLGSMSAALQFLHNKVPPETSEYSLVEVVLRESDRLNKIITNFLTYARPSADIFSKDNFSEINLGEAISDCLVLMRHSPEIKYTHNLESDLPESPVIIKANETQIKQIFWNLLQNSIQAMPDGGNLSIKLQDISPKNVQIIIEDTGKGISPEYFERLFEPFSSGGNGTGLGLSIVHKIVKDHGGRIDVQSQVAKGTKITVELPH